MVAIDGIGAGFRKLRERKYLAPVTGVTEQGLICPAPVLRTLAIEEGYNTDRARVAPASEETLGLYSGVVVDLQPDPSLSGGVCVPADESSTVTRRVASEGAEYVALHRQDAVEHVVITFADDNLSAAAACGTSVSRGAGFTAWRDREA